MNPKISIIVPVYNSERYLRRCIDSILSQTFTDYEVILVDDGSTDNSGHICDEYASNDRRITVFHKENGGVASARQIGLIKAKGEYSIHVDSDDWIEPNMLEQMYNKAKETNADIVITNFYNDFGKGHIDEVKQDVNGKTSIEIAQDIISEQLMGSLWNKLIRHDLFRKYNLGFIEGINYQEDALLISRLLCHDLIVIHIEHAYYHYCMENVNSITRTYSSITFQNRQLFWTKAKEILPADLFLNALDQSAFNIKMEAIKHKLLNFKSFNRQLPTSFKAIYESRLNWKDKIVLTFCCLLNNIGF